VSCLPSHENDIRTLDKLVNGVNETFDDRNMWLAPYLLERRDEGLFKVDHNEIIILFDKPKILSCIKFWNYSKTQTRGVKEIEILCDDNIIYRVNKSCIIGFNIILGIFENGSFRKRV